MVVLPLTGADLHPPWTLMLQLWVMAPRHSPRARLLWPVSLELWPQVVLPVSWPQVVLLESVFRVLSPFSRLQLRLHRRQVVLVERETCHQALVLRQALEL